MKKQIPETLRKQLSAAGKKGWQAKIERAKLQNKKVVAKPEPKIGK